MLFHVIPYYSMGNLSQGLQLMIPGCFTSHWAQIHLAAWPCGCGNDALRAENLRCRWPNGAGRVLHLHMEISHFMGVPCLIIHVLFGFSLKKHLYNL